MSEVIDPAADAAGAQAEYNLTAALKSVSLSILVNAVAPFALYKILVPYFPADSIVPLLYASAFPLLGLVFGLVRARAVDAIAAFALFGIAYSLATTLMAGDVHLALIIGATQGFVIAAFFFGSALAGQPILFFISRQFVAGNDPGRRAGYTAINALDGGRTFFLATMFWAVAIVLLTLVSLGLAFVMAPAPYILVNNIVNTGVNLVLVVVTFRFIRKRLEPLAGKLPG